jgi:mono/diheme cytochrome c family protein
VRAAVIAAGGLACAGAAMTIAAFSGGGSDPPAADQAAATGPRDGLTVWIEQGCGSCHTFEPAGAHMPMGPDLQQSLRGTPRAYVRESIVSPSKTASPGWGTGAMPEDYAQRIAPADLDALVDFIVDGVRETSG